MKYWLLTLLGAVVAGAGSYGVFYALNREPPALRTAARDGDAMEWLRVEFKLNDEQFHAIQKLHAEYGTVCARHCAAIMAAEKRGEVQSLESACVQSMNDHFHRVAALMSPEQGERYLAIVLPRVADYDHRGAPNLQARP